MSTVACASTCSNAGVNSLGRRPDYVLHTTTTTPPATCCPCPLDLLPLLPSVVKAHSAYRTVWNMRQPIISRPTHYSFAPCLQIKKSGGAKPHNESCLLLPFSIGCIRLIAIQQVTLPSRLKSTCQCWKVRVDTIRNILRYSMWLSWVVPYSAIHPT